MARGVGDVEGWKAVAWVAGNGAVLLLSAGALWLRARSFRNVPGRTATYREAGSPGATYTLRAAEVRGLAIVLLVVAALGQLLYVGLYYELASWLLGGLLAPKMSGDLFFWVLLVSVTCAGGALGTGWKRGPGD
jgi:hypothetical protein